MEPCNEAYMEPCNEAYMASQQVTYMTRLDRYIFGICVLMSIDIVLELVLAHLAVSVMPDR